MNQGPWFIMQKPLFLRYWQSWPVEKLSLQMVPIWIKIQNVLLELFTPESISCIASAVGKQLYLDKATAKHDVYLLQGFVWRQSKRGISLTL